MWVPRSAAARWARDSALQQLTGPDCLNAAAGGRVVSWRAPPCREHRRGAPSTTGPPTLKPDHRPTRPAPRAAPTKRSTDKAINGPSAHLTPPLANEVTVVRAQKSRSEERLFCESRKRLLGGRSGSVNGGRSSVNSGRSSVRSSRSSVGSSRSGFRSGRSDLGDSRSGFRSGRSGVSSSFFLLAASGQSHGSDQRSQQERLFHACVLKRECQ